MTELDKQLLPVFKEHGLDFAPLASDSVFLRRVYIDMIGSLPPSDVAAAFLADSSPAKRAKVIDQLLASEDYAVYWSMKWSDLLRVKSEFPINLWPNAAQAYHEWIYQSLLKNTPYDDFAKELLTSSGSNFRSPAVNFYRALQGKDAPSLARTAALTFMGTRIETWPENRRTQLEAFFSRVAFKPTAEWKEEIVYVDPNAFSKLTLTAPDGQTWEMPAGGDPRVYFAEWLTQKNNLWFARNQVNRQWAWLMHRGIIHEPDNIHPGNAPSHPKLLSYLEKEFIRSGYDIQHVFRLILNSRCYQQSSRPLGDYELSTAYFASYQVHRLEAEVLSDVICDLTDSSEQYVSMIPEPFTYIPEDTRTIAIADGSISSAFLQLFGRPERDTGYFAERNSTLTDKQALHLLNSSHILKKLNKSKWIRQLSKGKMGQECLSPVYLALFSRQPTEAEIRIAEQYCSAEGRKRWEASQDLLWAMINSKEFLYNH